MDATCESLDTISLNLLEEGITSFVPTTMTQSKECIIKSLKNIKDYTKTFRENRAEILGVHLEGPFINKEYKGAQNIENMIKIR